MYSSNEDYKYKVIRAKNEYIKTRIDNLKIENYIQKKELSLNNVPNASTLWCLIKEELKDNIDTCHNKLQNKKIIFFLFCTKLKIFNFAI
jgi:hypothetical protein